MRFIVGTDNRGGSVTAQGGGKSDPRDDNYNVDPSKRYEKITRTLSERDGAGEGQIGVTLETSSEFVGYRKETLDCAALTFKSKGTITLPKDRSSRALGVVQDSIALGVRIEQAGQGHLKASGVSDMDIAEIRLEGPSFETPIRIYDEHDETLDITKPGVYTLRGAYQLAVRLPNTSPGGRPLSGGMEATPNAAPNARQARRVVTATVEEASLDAGGAGEADIRLDIAEGFHVNANPASDKFYVATEVRAEPQEGVTPGTPVYPKSVTRKLSFSDKPLAVYEGRAVIRLPLRADKTAAKGRHSIHATIRVQPCNDKACLQPRNIDAYIPVTIN